MLTRRTFLLASAATLAVACSNSEPDELDVAGAVEELDLPGQRAIIIRPATPNDLLVVYHHGSGETERGLLVDPLKAELVTRLISAGYTLAASNAKGNNWGNQPAVDDYLALTATLAREFGPPVHLSQSMGGLTGLLTISQGAPTAGWCGIYPVCDLASMAGSKYDDAITAAGATQNPVDLDPSVFAGLPMRFYASPEDTVVLKAANSDRMAELVAPMAAEADVVECRGDHGDPSHFQPDDVLAFVGRCFA